MPRTHIGQYQALERPTTALQYTYADADGVPLDITEHAAVTFAMRSPAGVTTIAATAAIVSAWNGVVAVDWTTAMTATVGVWRGVFWLDDQVPSNTLVWTVVDGPGPTE